MNKNSINNHSRATNTLFVNVTNSYVMLNRDYQSVFI